MPYTPHTWIAGDSANASRLNNLEQQFVQALTSLNKDLIAAGFVLSGYTPTGTAGTATLNVAAGRAYLIQPGSNNDLGLVALGATTQTTATPSTTYHLYLQPDGTWYWSTSNSPAANSLAIANVTTDGSGNIATVTDQRTTVATLQPGVKFASIGGQATAGSFGAPVIVAQAIAVNVTVTTLQSVLTYSVPTTGLYRVSLHATAQPGVSAAPTAKVVFTDGNNPGLAIAAYFSWVGNPVVLLNGANSIGMPQSIATQPVTVYAASTHSIFVQWQDPSGTPNDFITTVIERLA